MSMVYRFIIDTDAYAGNFERGMTAWMTGNRSYGLSNAQELVKAAREEMDPHLLAWCDVHVIEQDIENGFYSCVDIAATPGWVNNGMGKKFRTDKPLDPKENRWPSYQSVAIFMNEHPPEHIVKQLAERARFFSRENYKKGKLPVGHMIDWRKEPPCNVTGFRLLCTEVTTTETMPARWNANGDFLLDGEPWDAIETLAFPKDEYSKGEAWGQVPTLPGNPWRKGHTDTHWAWYRTKASEDAAAAYIASQED